MGLGLTIVFAILMAPWIKSLLEGTGEVIGIVAEGVITTKETEETKTKRKIEWKQKDLEFWKHRLTQANRGYIDGDRHDEIDCKYARTMALEQIERITKGLS